MSSSTKLPLIDTADGGTASRKLWFSIGIAIAIFAAGMAAAIWSGILAIYPEMIGGLLGVLATYCGVNLGAKAITGRHVVSMHAAQLNAQSVEVDDPEDDANKPTHGGQ